MTIVLGVDGCRGGWVGAAVEGSRVSWHRFATIAEAMVLPVAAIGVGLSLEYGRRQTRRYIARAIEMRLPGADAVDGDPTPHA